MIRNCIVAALMALAAGAAGCRSCDPCYEEGPMVTGGCPTCGPTVRSGSGSGLPGPVYSNQPIYQQPGAVPTTAAQQRPMVPVR